MYANYGLDLGRIGAAAAAFLVYEAVTIPFLHGAGLAQVDFELFVFSVVLGVPGLIASVVGRLLVGARCPGISNRAPHLPSARSASTRHRAHALTHGCYG